MTTQLVIPSDNILNDLELYLGLDFVFQEITWSEAGGRRCFISDGHTTLCLEEWEKDKCPAPYLEMRVVCRNTFSELNFDLSYNPNVQKNIKHPNNLPYYSPYHYRNMGLVLLNIRQIEDGDEVDVPIEEQLQKLRVNDISKESKS